MKVGVPVHGTNATLMEKIMITPPPGIQCSGCTEFIEPDTCWCGEAKDSHSSAWDCGHGFVPMGCQCMKGVKPVNWAKYTGLTEAQLKEITDGH